MIGLRNEIMLSDDTELKSLQNFRDFYSLSELRDLIFHVQEHRFTIPRIRAALDELGLAFMGFEFIDTKKTIAAFKEIYPKQNQLYDLNKWHEYEILNPILFAGLNQFWVQKL